MSEEEIKKAFCVKNEELRSMKISPYEDVKKHLDKLANETAYNGAIEFSKLFKVQGT
jgi:hypothetical protein